MYKRILVPLDGSDIAEGVLPHALNLARNEGAEIILLTVATDAVAAFAFGDPALAGEFVETQESASQKYLSALQEKLTKEGYNVSHLVREGGVHNVIIAVSKEISADIIAMSTHARKGVAHLFLGSVAEKVLRLSAIPIMLIRPTVKS